MTRRDWVVGGFGAFLGIVAAFILGSALGALVREGAVNGPKSFVVEVPIDLESSSFSGRPIAFGTLEPGTKIEVTGTKGRQIQAKVFLMFERDEFEKSVSPLK
ncbi:MAG: hypothetical protein AAGC74_05975 [Verrucomicrobiota bacterium]